MKKITLLALAAFAVQFSAFAQLEEQENTSLNEQTYRIKNFATNKYLSYGETEPGSGINDFIPKDFDASDETQVYEFRSNSVVIDGSTFYTIDMGGADLSRGALRIAGSGAGFKMFSTTKKWSDTSGMSDKVQNVHILEIGVPNAIRIQAKTANSFARENTAEEVTAGTHVALYTAPELNADDPRQVWVLEDGTLNTNQFTESNVFVSNPVKNQMYIKVGDSKISQVTVYSILGSQILSKTFNNESAIGFDVSSLTSGMYIVKIKGDGGSFTKKIIKE